MRRIAEQVNKRSRQPAQYQCASKRSRYASWKRDMIIVGSKELISVASWDAMDQNVVNGLNIERFFDLSVRRHEQVDQNECGDEQEERPCWKGHGI